MTTPPVKEWFYRDGEEVIGPLSRKAIDELWQCSAIDASTLLASVHDQENWSPIDAALSFSSPSQTGKILSTDKFRNLMKQFRTGVGSCCIRICKSQLLKNFAVFLLGLAFTAGVIFAVVHFSSEKAEVDQISGDATEPKATQSAKLVKEADQIAFISTSDPDWSKAANLLERATELGNPEAAMKLGHCYLTGRGVPKNAEKAVELFRKSANAGHAEGQYNLAVSYAKGIGAKKDEEAMLRWLIPAADQELPEAMDSLGIRYLTGSAVPKNSAKGFQLISKAAEKGFSGSQYQMSLCYEFGDGVEQDNLQAYRWALIAERNGLKIEAKEIARLKARLSHQEMQQAQEFTNDRKEPTSPTQNQKEANQPDITIIKATFGRGRKWADVTTRVQDLVDILKDGFKVSPKDLKKDPTPGWKKELRVTFSVNGQTLKKKFKEGKQVNISDLLAKTVKQDSAKEK